MLISFFKVHCVCFWLEAKLLGTTDFLIRNLCLQENNLQESDRFGITFEFFPENSNPCSFVREYFHIVKTKTSVVVSNRQREIWTIFILTENTTSK